MGVPTSFKGATENPLIFSRFPAQQQMRIMSSGQPA